jgi:hypothetical protein
MLPRRFGAMIRRRRHSRIFSFMSAIAMFFVAACLAVASVTLPSVTAADAPVQPLPSSLVGRWDIVVDEPGYHHNTAAWLEVRRSGRSTLVGAFVNMVGSTRPVAEIEYDEAAGSFTFSIPPQWDDAEGETTVTGRLRGDSISGAIATASGWRQTFKGERAPRLLRATPPTWGAAVALFNGKDLSGWKTVGQGANHWEAASGVLRNDAAGAGLITEGLFTDFKLHVEFRYPPGGNSGIFLRGRHEVQIEDTPGDEPKIDGLGAVYGHLVPNELASLGPGEWQSYDITLIGRRVTVVLNGRAIIVDQIIPGITGGALDSNEGAPGPIFLQGDHGPAEYRNIVITPAQ